MIEERTGIITFQGNPLTLIGKGVSVGEAAPEFCVLANDLSFLPSETFRLIWQRPLLISQERPLF